jgi:hypothetical protein
MKRLAPIFVILLMAFSGYAQVGINTTEPTSTLDVNGTIRVRGAKFSSYDNDIIAKHIIGIDDDGNMVEVEVDENLILENNKIRAVNQILKIGDVPGLNVPIINDLNLVIWPGEPNDDKSVIKLNSILGDMIITGLVAGQDGQQIWLYPVSGDLTLVPNSLLSLFANQIEQNNNMIVPRYSMVRLMYDATRSKWIIMDH